MLITATESCSGQEEGLPCKRMAIHAPFIKVEATKFTEVGYVGRDVESIIRDLTENAVRMVRKEHTDRVRTRAQVLAEDRLVTLLTEPPKKEEEKKENPQSPTEGIADEFIQNILESYLKKY